MVRTREFNEDFVIDRVVRAFSKNSYSSTSVAALESATGVGRKSLYNTFGSKQALLLRALETFARDSAMSFVQPLERSGAGRTEIELVVRAMVGQMTSRSGRGGCLLCTSSQDPIGSSKPVARLIDTYFVRVRAGFLKCVKTGIKAGEITTSTPPAKIADYLVGVLMGISTMARAGERSRTIENYADVALRALG